METRHPHRHKDPRQPRNEAVVHADPPVFVWKPDVPEPPYELRVSRKRDLSSPELTISDLDDSLYLPPERLEPGHYYWTWASKRGTSSVFDFRIADDAAIVEVPLASEWLNFTSHPRLFVDSESVLELKQFCNGGKHPLLDDLDLAVGKIMKQPHSMAEPPYLADRNVNYSDFIKSFQRTMWDSREFALDSTLLALKWLVTGGERFGRAACDRFVSMASWDPDGSSSIEHNDEAHMSIIWHGTPGIDWVWDLFDESERKLVADHLRKRALNTFEFMHDRGTYGIDRFDSHAGREIVFLAWTLLAFHEEIPGAEVMLDWLRPVLCGLWPAWASDDGSWAEGISYSLAYVSIMSDFAFILKRSTGIDLFAKPFWNGHAGWRSACMPPYAEWIGFGDHSEVWKQTWLRSAELVELIGRETGNANHIRYADELRSELPSLRSRENVMDHLFTLPSFFSAGDTVAVDAPVEIEASPKASTASPAKSSAAPGGSNAVLSVFPDAGWAAFRTAPSDFARDVALLFRSSPFGAISHSHANNNDFALHVGGRALLIPSGIYAGYGSPHHANWVWHTKSHNCATLSGASQLLRSYDSVGRLDGSFEDDEIAYVRGVGASSFAHLATRYTRHIVLVKNPLCILLVDSFCSLPGINVSYEWNVHSAHPFDWDESERRFEVVAPGQGAKESAGVTGRFLHEYTATCGLSSGFYPEPTPTVSNTAPADDYHLQFTLALHHPELLLPVLLIPVASQLEEVAVEMGSRTARVEAAESCVVSWDDSSVTLEGRFGEINIHEDSFRLH